MDESFGYSAFLGGEKRGGGARILRTDKKKDGALIGKFERKGNCRGRKATAQRQTAGKMWFARKEREEVIVREKGK